MNRYGRLIVLCILLIPLLVASYGWTLLRESAFYIFYLMQPDGSLETPEVVWQLVWHLVGGGTLFLLGLSFLGGFFWYRHRKRKKTPS